MAALSLPTIGAVLVVSNGQKPQEITVTIRRATAGLGDSKGVDGIDPKGRLHADNFFPFQTVVAVQLAPTHPGVWVSRWNPSCLFTVICGGQKSIGLRIRGWVLRRPFKCPRQVGSGRCVMQPAFVIRYDGGRAYQPNSRLLFLDQNLTTCKLFAKRNLAIGADNLDSGG